MGAEHDQAGDQTTQDPGPQVMPGADLIGRTVGRYQIKRAIATGGMGVVYEALQESPRRVVALKVMKAGIASRSALRRFEYESQILGRLRHPGIAQIYEAGTHRQGAEELPFFAMEYIPGARTITEYAREKKLGTRERLDLFAKACEAVHHGHQKGIIHRDLKPSNILVDSSGQPKIIDFGVARATDSDMAVTTLQTDVGQLIGTLQYMSPEQCDADPHDIDTRSDVYALGVVLYELLCDRLPYDLSRVAMFEAVRVIREQAPTKPSTVLKMLRGDVETIALKALEKDRLRRYQSAAELEADLRHYLNNEPISAAPPSLAYQVRAFARRNRTMFRAAVAVLLAILLGLSGVIWQNVEVRRQAARADERAGAATRAEQSARAAEREQRRLADLESAARGLADRKADEAEAARLAAEQEVYLANLYAADASLLANDPERARARLLTCPLRFRGWEWEWLVARSDQSLAVLQGHEGLVWRAVFSPDSARVVSASEDRTARVWDSITGRQLAVLRGHQDGVYSAVFSPDGARVATVSRDGTARVWDSETGRVLLVLRAGETNPGPRGEGPARRGAPLTWLNDCQFSPDGNWIVTASNDKTARIWDASEGKQRAVLEGHEGRVLSVVFSPGGDRIVTSSDDGTVRSWSAATGAAEIVFRGHKKAARANFNPQGTQIVTTSDEAIARVWDVTTGAEMLVLRGHEGTIFSAGFSPDGTKIVTASADKTSRIWDAQDGRELGALRGHVGAVNAAVYSPDGSRIVSTSEDRTVRIWDSTSGKELMVLIGHDHHMARPSFSRDGTRIVTSSDDKTVRVWSAISPSKPAILRGHQAEVYAATFSPSGERVITTSRDGTARIWNAFTGTELSLLRGQEKDVRSAAFSPLGDRVVTVSLDAVRVWDAGTGMEMAKLNAGPKKVTAATFSPDGSRLFLASEGGAARVWSPASGHEQAVPSVEWSWTHSATFSHDGTMVVGIGGGLEPKSADMYLAACIWDVASWDHRTALHIRSGSVASAGTAFSAVDDRVLVWQHGAHVLDPATGKELFVLRDYRAQITGGAFSADGRQIATASYDQTARIWDGTDGREIAVMRGHGQDVRTVCFGPDGTRLVTASGDGTARLWNTADGRELVVLRGHERGVTSAVFSSDGSRILTASDDGTARIWDKVTVQKRDPAWLTAKAAEVRISEVVRLPLLSGETAATRLERLAVDTSLTPEERHAARAELCTLTEAEHVRLEEANSLNTEAWGVVRARESEPNELRKALAKARRAASLAPGNPYIVNTLAVALYRADDFEESLATLLQAETLYASLTDESRRGPEPSDWAFIAMCHHKLGHVKEAKDALQKLRDLMAARGHATNVELQAFLHEAEVLIEGE